MLPAVRRDGAALEFASAALREDREVDLARSCIKCVDFVSDAFPAVGECWDNQLMACANNVC